MKTAPSAAQHITAVWRAGTDMRCHMLNMTRRLGQITAKDREYADQLSKEWLRVVRAADRDGLFTE